MNKQIVAGITVLIIAVIGIAAFCLFKKETNYYGYTVKMVSGGKLVENRKEGLSMKVPNDWEPKPKSLSDSKYQIDFFSPEALSTAKPVSNVIEQGCKLTTLISPQKTNLKEIEDQNNSAESPTGESVKVKNEIIDISGKKGVKSITDYGSLIGSVITVDVPTDNKVYSFIMYQGTKSEEQCSKAFNDFLQTVSIK